MKPYVICHMMAPLDGRLIVSDWAKATGHSLDELVEVYDAVHDGIGADAWLSGRKTGEEFASASFASVTEASATPKRSVHVANPSATSFAVIIDKDGQLRWAAGDIDGAHLIVILGPQVSDEHLSRLAGVGVSYVVSSGPKIDLSQTMKTLATRFGIKRLMLEGGARTNGEFLKAGLVDEISLVLFPGIGGKSNTPAIFEGGSDGLADVGALELISVDKAGLGSLHIRYKVLK
ncbi:dihydrofolate reductase family protein [Rhizobium sp. IMFF44]|uniref:dihydrofolate reductase family protein n=1 Tax=Rhizobium sp. IMFF44 TaxID=3342350 RepID=UPI0035BA313E